MRLELRGVTAAYGDLVALRDVSIVVPSGQTVALIGPNGAGKTTLLSTLSGLLPVRSGRILVDRNDVTGHSIEQMVERGVCHITEGRSMFPGLTVRDNLRMFAPGERNGTERAVDAFPRLGDLMDRAAGTLSGGEQQMLALARAYISEAPVVLLDEVSMGLAPLVVEEIFRFLRKLSDAGRSVLLVEQYVAKALEIADLVYVLARGRVVYVGEPVELADSDILARYLGQDAALDVPRPHRRVPATS